MFEENLNKALFTQQAEKTFIDKLLAKDDVNRISQIIKKPKLTREELLELLYLLSGTEAKLVNYSDWDRYVVLKFFVWIREFIKIAELLYDYQDNLKKKEKTGVLRLTARTKTLLDNNERLIEHNAKFLIDLYFNIARTTLSLGGAAFFDALKNKYEIAYPQGVPLATPQQAPPQKKERSWFGRK
jgi:hypothetical protein